MKTILNFNFSRAKIGPIQGEATVIVCHCKAVNDRSIRQAVRGGARTRLQVSLACSAGRTCGGCIPTIEAILEDEEGEGRAVNGAASHLDRAAAG